MTADVELHVQVGVLAPGARLERELPVRLLRDAAGVEREVRDGELLPGGKVAVRDRRAVDVDAGDVEGDRLAALLFALLGLFFRRLARRFLLLQQVAEVERAVLVAHHVGLQAGDADAVDDRLPAQQRHQLHRGVRGVERQERLARVLLGKGHPRDLGTQARPEREPDVALQLERAPGFFLHHALDLALVAVGVESHREHRHPDYREKQQPT